MRGSSNAREEHEFTDAVTVGYSTRLGPISQVERDLLDIDGVTLVEMDLQSEQQILSEGLIADYLIVGSIEPLSREVLTQMERLKMVVRRGTGTDNVDIDAATECGIGVANVPDASVEEVSDHALALALALIRRIPTVVKAVDAGQSATVRVLAETAPRVSELIAGVVGLGLIGSRFASKARPLFKEVLGYDPVVTSSPGVRTVGLEALLEQSDVVSIHVPLTSGTRGMFDEDAFSRMKSGAVLVNTARGEVVVEDALIGALESGKVSGAGLDVTIEDPPSSGHPLLKYSNVLHTSHTAGLGEQASIDLRRRSVEAVVSAVKGHYPDTMLNRQAWTMPPAPVGRINR